jgi:hypothetical protein
MLTIFTFGYWGWGNATRELIRSIDKIERERGYRSPILIDIRISRSVRAPGFYEAALEKQLGRERYKWFPRLGNLQVKRKRQGITIADPFAATVLLRKAVKYAAENRRIIVFCACPSPRHCHRRVVGNLILKEASRLGKRIEVVEWPGGAPLRSKIRVTDKEFSAADKPLVKNVRVAAPTALQRFAGLPWGSIVDIQSGKNSFPIITGPAKFQKEWMLPIQDKYEPNTSAARLHLASDRFRRSHGALGRQSTRHSFGRKREIRAISVQQPWAHAIIHLGKDVENRSWKGRYSGLVLIHASARVPRDPRDLLLEWLSNPPSEKSLRGLPGGVIIGVVELYDYVQDSKSRWAGSDCWHWLLRNPRPIKPVQCSGRLGLWKPSHSVMRQLPQWVKRLSS